VTNCLQLNANRASAPNVAAAFSPAPDRNEGSLTAFGVTPPHRVQAFRLLRGGAGSRYAEARLTAALKMAKAAPCGSAMTEMRPTFSKSVGGM